MAIYRSVFPDNAFRMSGDEPVTLQEALRLMGELNDMEELEGQVRHAIRSNDATQIDADALGDEARRLRTL